MNNQQRAFRFLLVFALLAGQWLYAAHTHHEDALDSDHLCQLCVHGAKLDAFLPVVLLNPSTPIPEQLFVAQAQTTAPALYTRFHDSRAPPYGG